MQVVGARSLLATALLPRLHRADVVLDLAAFVFHRDVQAKALKVTIRAFMQLARRGTLTLSSRGIPYP